MGQIGRADDDDEETSGEPETGVPAPAGGGGDGDSPDDQGPDGEYETGSDEEGSEGEGSEGEEEDHGQSAMIGTVGTRTLGIERYVQAAYLATALVLFWILQRSALLVWNMFTEPNIIIATAGAAVAGLALTWGLYKNPQVNKLTTEVATELSKVTWPTRAETYTSTVVVIVTSIVAALYLGFWDFLWSALTDLVYKV